MDTDSLWLTLAEEKLYDCIQPDKRAAWEKMRENDCRDSFKTMQNLIASLELVTVRIRRMIKGSLGFLKRNFGAQKCYVYVARLIAAMTTSQKNSNLAAKD